MKVIFSPFLIINARALSGWFVWFTFLMARQINKSPLLPVRYCTLEGTLSLVVCYQESFDVLCSAVVSNIRINLLGQEGI